MADDRVAQDALFADELPVLGFRGPIAAKAAGVSYRQLDYWARTGLVAPELNSASGSGSQRLYSFRDIVLLRLVKRLLDTGIALPQIRIAMDYLRTRGVHDLTAITLLSDGVSVYEAISDEEVLDIVKGGQSVFAIMLGGIVRDVEGSIAQFPVADETPAIVQSVDELAARRIRRAS